MAPLEHRSAPRIEVARAANRPAVALELHLHHERLTLYLSPRTYRPLVVLGAVGGEIASARIYLTRLTYSRLAQFRRLAAKALPTRQASADASIGISTAI